MDIHEIKKLGILAGAGSLPYIAAKTATDAGIEIQIYAVQEEAHRIPLAKEFKKNTRVISLAKAGKFLEAVEEDGITHMVMLGKVPKKHLFNPGLFLDPVSRQFLASLKDKKDDTILSQFVRALSERGVEAVSQKLFLRPLLLKEGVYSKRQPTKAILEDAYFGMEHAKKIGEWDIGQTVVVKDKSVLAVEAIEGTDQCILRGGKLARKKGAVVCKAEKKNQDERFDIPTVGEDTLKVMKKAGADVLVIQAEKTFVVNPNRFVDIINKNQMVFMAVL